jgi:hypothetical protein
MLKYRMAFVACELLERFSRTAEPAGTRCSRPHASSRVRHPELSVREVLIDRTIGSAIALRVHRGRHRAQTRLFILLARHGLQWASLSRSV